MAFELVKLVGVNTVTIKGDPGKGVPIGGTTGQVLRKKSNDDFDTEFTDSAGNTPGNATGDISRWNDVSKAWEVATEPLVFKGIVLTPALASLIEVEGAMYYKSGDKVVMVCTDI